MRTISVGAGAHEALVDEDDFELVDESVWVLKKWRTNAYAIEYLYEEPRLPGGGYPFIAMHKLITGWDYVDHINGNGLDNRRENLRQVTHKQNIQNQRTQERSKSGYRGVTHFPNAGTWKRSKPWRARIKIDGRDITIGYYSTKEEAAEAWNEVAEEAWGEHAHLNIINPL